MSKLKKLGKQLFSMKFAIGLLVVLALYCSAGSFISQGQSYEWYAATYSERTAGLIIALHLDDAFHSVTFIVLSALLCLDLLMCDIIRLPSLLRRFRAERDPERILKSSADCSAEGLADPAPVFEAFHMMQVHSGTTEEGTEYCAASKHSIGLWGAWICHLGILLLILGFGLGQMTKEQYAVYGVAGQTRQIGNTEKFVTIDDFQVDLRADDTVRQYTASLTVTDVAAGTSESGKASVNHPAKLFGMKFYQNSTGWAATVRIFKDEALLQEEVLCAGEYMTVEDMPDLTIWLNAFYPDYALVDGQPLTMSGSMNNPGYLYSVYYADQVIGMNVLMEGEQITIDDYTVTFSDPQSYTILQIKRDRFVWLAFIGGMILMLGLGLAFYLQPVKIWALRTEEGWTVYGSSRKGGALFKERFEQAVQVENGETTA